MDLVTAPPRSPAAGVLRLVSGEAALRRWALASLVANIGIVVTGGVVRLTASGLGCPTWPRCTEDAYVAHPALGLHGAIEFGNRLLTFVLIVIAVLTWVTAMRVRLDGHPRRGVRRVATAMALGIPAQGVLGGVTVLTQLNPFVVALHFLLSMVLITLAVWLVRSAYRVNREPVAPVTAAVVTFTFVAMWVAVWLGTMTTGSGPHAGDEDARRTGWDIVFVAHVHALAVYAAIAGTVVALWLARSRAVVLLLGVEVIQAAIGLTQYHLGLPIGLVALHLLGAALSIAAVANLRFSVRRVRARGDA
ncbi:MAG TPA: COX15/CtaA family protein [Microlunatus sp.]|jgi:cytochrome c oxidase assembly protein subunit 15|nr:COX15/CtaA family protein [Microlunatus sp.]